MDSAQVASMYPQAVQPLNPLAVMSTAGALMGQLNANKLFQQQNAARNAMQGIVANSIDPTTGQMDYGKFALGIGTHPATAPLAMDLLPKVAEMHNIDQQTQAKALENTRTRYSIAGQEAQNVLASKSPLEAINLAADYAPALKAAGMGDSDIQNMLRSSAGQDPRKFLAGMLGRSMDANTFVNAVHARNQLSLGNKVVQAESNLLTPPGQASLQGTSDVGFNGPSPESQTAPFALRGPNNEPMVAPTGSVVGTVDNKTGKLIPGNVSMPNATPVQTGLSPTSEKTLEMSPTWAQAEMSNAPKLATVRTLKKISDQLGDGGVTADAREKLLSITHDLKLYAPDIMKGSLEDFEKTITPDVVDPKKAQFALQQLFNQQSIQSVLEDSKDLSGQTYKGTHELNAMYEAHPGLTTTKAGRDFLLAQAEAKLRGPEMTHKAWNAFQQGRKTPGSEFYGMQPQDFNDHVLPRVAKRLTTAAEPNSSTLGTGDVPWNK